MRRAESNHYATLGLDRRCTATDIRAAYRALAKQHHPDLNPDSPAAVQRTQELNTAYETLSEPARRQEYDRELAARKQPASHAGRAVLNLNKDVHVRLEDFLRGASLEVRVNDPGSSDGAEIYELIVPPETAPKTLFRLARSGGGFVVVRVKARPDFRFKVRGSDLRCNLRISSQSALQGGAESLRGAAGNCLRVQIPPKVTRGEIIRLPGEGLPKARGGRGDLLVRVIYAPEVRIRRAQRR